MHAGAVMLGPASSVAEALRLIEEAVPQIVLLDYRLANHETSDPVAATLTALGIPSSLPLAWRISSCPKRSARAGC